jgi:hypothetical protein
MANLGEREEKLAAESQWDFVTVQSLVRSASDRDMSPAGDPTCNP